MSVNTQLDRLENAKAAIKTAIEGKGVTVPSATKLDEMASLIESITPLLQSKSVTITSNGTINIKSDSGYDGLREAIVKVNVPDSGSALYNFSIVNNLANSPVEYNIGDDIGVVPGGETVELTPSTLYNVLTNICIQFPIRNSWLSTYTDSSTTPKTIVFSIEPEE